MPVERLREQFMQDANMFYALGRKQPPPKSDAAPKEVISVASTSSTSSGSRTESVHKPRTRPIVISSDEDGSEIEVLQSVAIRTPSSDDSSEQLPKSNTSKPLQPYNQARRMPQIPYPPAPEEVLGKPIHIPSNKDLPLPTAALAKPLNMPQDPFAQHVSINVTDDGDVDMTAAETEKALRELISGNINDDITIEINPDDAIVEGFKEGFTLLDHQIVGRNWMKGREDVAAKKYGGILADDMGLGKTIQTLARIVDNPARKSDRDDGWSASTLVICPLALVGQWADEIQRMTNLSVIKHQGTSRTTDPLMLRKHKVVVTTYDTVKSEYAAFHPAKDESKKGSKSKSKEAQEDDDDLSDDAEHFGRTIAKKVTTSKRKAKCALFEIKWFRIVLDEAHNIKNHTTKGAVACCELQGKFRWCLTGTPLQNNVSELYSLFKFLRIRPLNDLENYNAHIAKPIQRAKGAGRAMKRLQLVLTQIMLRRRKDDVLNGKKLIELPKRTVELVSCPFDHSEKLFYESLENKMGDVLEKLMSSGNQNNKYISVLLLLLRLRQACNHPLLVSQDYKKDLEAIESQPAKKDSPGNDADDLVAAFGQLGVTRKCRMCTIELDSHNVGEGQWSAYCLQCIPLAENALRAEQERPSSAKIRMILKLLQEIDERSGKEEKTIIFSQFTSMLDLIGPFLREKGIKYARYDGSMSPVDREAALTRIKTSQDTRVILISFKAGSTGLNLTACNNVILVDLWWNPALEDQAFDRAHRFGQKKDVNIFKLKIDNTVEERILLLQEKKRALAQAALSGDKLKNMRLGMDDLLALFRPNSRDNDSDSDDGY